MRPANSELVTVAFIKTMPGVPSNGVATQLPADNSSWASTGFVKVGPVVGGSSQLYVKAPSPVIEVSCYATNPNTKYPAWDKATDLMEYIREGTFNYSLIGRSIATRSGYRNAIVRSSYFASEPFRVEQDDSAYAIIQVDLGLSWIEVPE